MSSPLHTAVCRRREGVLVEIELEPTGAIDPHFQLSDFYAFAILHESASARAIPEGTTPTRFPPELRGALAGEADPIEMIDMSSVDSPERRALAARYIACAGYVSTRNWTPTVCTLTDGVYRIGAAPNGPASRVVHARLRALAATPTATLRIEVTDPRWCSHLEAQLQWDVYAFDDEAPLLM
jgi:hypothetical protein